MELDNLKSAYQNAGKAMLSKENIQKMIVENNNPVAKSIKKQLLIETILWAIFLAVYYNIFDGHLKSPLWNILLVLSVIFILVHNALGFQIINHPINGETILESLKNYQNKIKNYAFVSIVTRVLAIAILLGYFISTIQFTKEKFISLGFIALIFPVQIYLLYRVWAKRKNRINAIFQKLKE
jgi:succinate dehydrogenase hydrophobic anchor subunit